MTLRAPEDLPNVPLPPPPGMEGWPNAVDTPCAWSRDCLTKGYAPSCCSEGTRIPQTVKIHLPAEKAARIQELHLQVQMVDRLLVEFLPAQMVDRMR